MANEQKGHRHSWGAGRAESARKWFPLLNLRLLRPQPSFLAWSNKCRCLGSRGKPDAAALPPLGRGFPFCVDALSRLLTTSLTKQGRIQALPGFRSQVQRWPKQPPEDLLDISPAESPR